MIIANRSEREADHPGDDGDPRRPVVGLARELPPGYVFPRHRHLRAQLLYSSRGVLTFTTDIAAWVVPPQQAVWIPAGIPHEVRADMPLSMRSLYLHPRVAAILPADCRVVPVSALLRELILRIVAAPREQRPQPAMRRLTAVLFDELRRLAPTPLFLPLPRDPRVHALTAGLLGNAADGRPLAEWAEQVGASPRTLRRHFRAETGMSFAQWRQRLRLLTALRRLAEGQPVTAVALDLGYRSPSAFTAMFRRSLGAPPQRFLQAAGSMVRGVDEAAHIAGE